MTVHPGLEVIHQETLSKQAEAKLSLRACTKMISVQQVQVNRNRNHFFSHLAPSLLRSNVVREWHPSNIIGNQ